MSLVEAIPSHELNDILIENVAPRDWKNPTPAAEYDLVVIGGGSAGLVAASAAAQLGAKVALIEKNMLGGDCLNVGCMPSKAIIRASKAMSEINNAAAFGITVPDGVTVDFAKVMEHVWHTRAAIAPHDSAERFTKLGIDIFFDVATFSSEHTVTLGDGVTLTFKKALIATGSQPRHLPIPGLAEAGYLTNETLWNVTTQPQSLAVIGAGPIGCEIAQAFQRLGTQVILIDLSDQVLIREDPDAAAIVQAQLVKDGVDLRLGVKTSAVSAENGKKFLTLDADGALDTVIVDEILLAVGRTPNVDGLNLEAAAVASTKRGVTVDDYLQTTNPDIFGAGDVAMKYQFTHAAGHAAALVVRNALYRVPKGKLSSLIMPWATYTSPEIAHVGLYAKDAAEQGIEIDTYTESLEHNDRAIADNARAGFIRVHTKKGSGKIVGATIVASHASEMINEITVAMNNNVGIGKFSSAIHPYPTQSEAITRIATEYSKTRLSPLVKTGMDLLRR